MSNKLVALRVLTERELSGAPQTILVQNAWLYFHAPQSGLLLRLDAKGHAHRHTKGPVDQAASYQTLFTTKLSDARMAFSTEPVPLTEAHLLGRLDTAPIERPGFLVVLPDGATKVRTDGVKQQTAATALGQVRLSDYRPSVAVRAVVATQFGGRASDDHARLMDKFVRLNYGLPGGAVKRFTGRPDAHPSHSPRPEVDEIRRTIAANGIEPLNIIDDIGRAAAKLANDDALERVVALVTHGFGGADPGVMRVPRGNALTLGTLTSLAQFRDDLEGLRTELKKAEAEGTASDIQKARDALDKQLALPGMDFVNAFEQAAETMEKSGVRTLELQACNQAGPANAPDISSAFLKKLGEFLSTSDHAVTVKGHRGFLSSFEPGSGVSDRRVQVFLGRDPVQDGKLETSQFSKDTLPVP
ncbi:MAG: hypothetical protein RJA70_4210 [Pseudomonadota bacterium]